jgi:phosphatidylglycerophosphatase A
MTAHPKLELRLLADPVHLLALGFGTGLSPRAPGTCGSLLAVPFTWWLLGTEWWFRFAVVTLAVIAGVWICGESARRIGAHDHPGIVWDEIAAMLALSLVMPRDFWWLAAAFGLFRFFDIAKPWPIRDLDHRLGGGVGIMLDDLMAALYTAACVWTANYLGIFSVTYGASPS